MAIDWGDAAGWAALAVSVPSAGVAVWAVLEARRNRQAAERSANASEDSSQSARRSADAGERSAEAAEKSHQLAEQQYRDSLPSPVAWDIESAGKERYVLRNVGTETARNVTVDRTRIEGLLVLGAEPPQGATIPSGGGHAFTLAPDFNHQLPNEVWLTWAGQSAPVAVPLPAW